MQRAVLQTFQPKDLGWAFSTFTSHDLTSLGLLKV